MPRRFLKSLTLTRLIKLWYLPLLALGMGLMFLRLLLMARLLSLQEFGIYSSGILISSSFLMLACLGLLSILQRELPVMIVRQRERSGIVLTIQCALIAMVCATLGAGIALSCNISLAGTAPAIVALGLLHGLSQQAFLIATTESRSRGEPVRYSLDNLYRSLFMLLAGTFVALFTEQALYALLIEAIISLFIAVFLLRHQLLRTTLPVWVIFHLAWRRLRVINWLSALTLMTVGTLAFVMLNADRWIAAQWLVSVDFAQYAFAWIVLTGAQAAQVIINTTLYPMIARRFASSGSATAFKMGAQASLASLCIGALFALPIWAVFDYSIQRWYPAYVQARPLLPIFIAIAVLRLSDFWSTYLVIAGKEMPLLLMNLAAICLSLTLWWLLFRPTGVRFELKQAAYFAGTLALTGYVSAAFLAIWMDCRRSN